MCTAVAFTNQDFYFGRTLDLEYSYQEEITVTPRNFPFRFRRLQGKAAVIANHYALIGTAYNVEGYPLYYEAINEAGLGMAGLNFPDYAVYMPYAEGMDNVAPFEFIPWILSRCATVAQAREALSRVNLINISFSKELPLSPLHWLIADKKESVTVESVASGLRVYDNPIGILTNNPPFEYHMTNLANYMALSTNPPVNHFSDKIQLVPYSRGMGAMGLPGDLSSASRFVKAAFTKLNSCCGDSEAESVSQFFHIMGSVEQQRGCVYMGEGQYEVTVYTACCNADKGIYYYTSYENSQITAVDMHRADLESCELFALPMLREQNILWQN